MTRTRTTIIDANGVRYAPETRAKIRTRRLLISLAACAIAPFLAAAAVGISMGINDISSDHSPSIANLRTLAAAKKANPKGNCRLEWNEIQKDHEAICDGTDIVKIIRDLYARPAITKGAISDPAGPALVNECLSDTSLTTDEVRACLTQPKN